MWNRFHLCVWCLGLSRRVMLAEDHRQLATWMAAEWIVCCSCRTRCSRWRLQETQDVIRIGASRRQKSDLETQRTTSTSASCAFGRSWIIRWIEDDVTFEHNKMSIVVIMSFVSFAQYLLHLGQVAFVAYFEMAIYFYEFLFYPEWLQFGFWSQTGDQLHCIIAQPSELQVDILHNFLI